MPKSVWLLVLFASIVMTCAPFIALTGGLLGHQLSPAENLRTMPVAIFIIGAAIFVYPVIRLMGRWGRKPIFLCACGVMAIASLFAGFAVQATSFAGLCVACFFLGGVQSVFAQIRFAAMELVPGDQAATAASRVMLSGLVAAVVGPELAIRGQNLFGSGFAGGFVLLAFFAVLGAGILAFGYQDRKVSDSQKADMLSHASVWRKPWFWLALSSAAVGYCVMSFVMTATPLTMHIDHHHDLVRVKEVIQGHIIAMFLPSLISARLFNRIGPSNMILLGILCFFASIIAGLSGVMLMHFWLGLLLLGVGWNFMFIAGTTLLPKASVGADRFRVQAINDLVVVSCQAVAASGAGWFLSQWGWSTLLLSCLPLLLLPTFLIIWIRLGKIEL